MGTPLKVLLATPALAVGNLFSDVTTAKRNLLGRNAAASRIKWLFWMTLASATAMFGQVNVLTFHNDNARTGQNLSETILTPANVNPSTFELLFTLSVDGKVDAQPLYVSGLTIAGGVHNVLYVATEHDSLYAFDADNGAILKQVSLLGTNESTSDARGCSEITPEIGITATPVIQTKIGPNGTIYVVAMSKNPSGIYFQRIHALDLTTLTEEFGGPTDINATYPGTGDEKTNSTDVVQTFDPKEHKERAALLLSNGVVYTTWSSHCDVSPYTSWIISYSATTLARLGVLNLVPNGSDGGIWSSGSGPSTDDSGNLYVATGNGTFDTTLTAGFPVKSDFGNAIVRITPNGGAMAVADYFTMSTTTSESKLDLDLASGGLMLLPPLNDSQGNPRQLAVAAGKDTNIYVVDRTNLGKYTNPGPDAIFQELSGALVGGVWASPGWFNGNLYYGPAGNVIKIFTFANGTFGVNPVSVSSHFFAFPGATPSISANGTSNGIVWAAENINPAVLHAYDANSLNPELYNSTMAAHGRDNFGNGNKFMVPTVANGKVYVGTTNGVGVFGLAPVPASITATAGTSQSQTLGNAYVTNLAATVMDSNNTPVGGAVVTFTAPATGASGTFANGTSTTQVTTNGFGVATATVFTANATTGAYAVTASVPGVVAQANFNLTNKPSATGGVLVGSVNSSAAAINLTTEGASDWEHWGDGSLNRKASVSAQLSNYTAIGGGSILTYTNDPRPINWSDGTPTATSASNHNGIYINSTGHGFSLTSPADTTQRTLTVHLGGWNSGATLTAHLSDGSAADYTFTTSTASGSYDANFTLTYSAPSSGQLLTVTWKMASGSGNVTLNAAALSTAGGSVGTGSITATAGTSQSATVGTAFTTLLQATVKDASNNPVNGAMVTFTAPATGASGTFANATTMTVVTTSALGIATATTFTANSIAGGYTVTASVSGVPTPANFNLTNLAVVIPGALSGSGNSLATAINLTSEGTTDWEHWGESSLTRKAGVTAKLTNYTIVGGGSVSKYSNDPRPINWTDGTPTASSPNNRNGVYINSSGHGFSFTAPADTTTHTLVVHVGGWNSGAMLTAHLSDGSAMDFTDTTATATGQYDRNYTLTYNAKAAGATITVTWKMTSGSGNVTLNAAALQ